MSDKPEENMMFPGLPGWNPGDPVGFMAGFGETIANAVVKVLMPILEPKMQNIVDTVTATVKADVQQLLAVGKADFAKVMSDMGDALKSDVGVDTVLGPPAGQKVSGSSEPPADPAQSGDVS